MSATAESIAAILKTTPKNLPVRVTRLRLGDTCGRCGGSGHYSYNQVNGSTCFGCGGAGQVMPKNLTALQARAEKAVAAGKLAIYLDELRAAKAVKGASDTFFAAWSAITKAYPYDWRKAVDDNRAGRPTVDRFRCDQNAIVAALHDRFKAVLDQYQFPKKGTERLSPLAVEAELKAALVEIARVRAVVAAHAEANPEDQAKTVADRQAQIDRRNVRFGIA